MMKIKLFRRSPRAGLLGFILLALGLLVAIIAGWKMIAQRGEAEQSLSLEPAIAQDLSNHAIEPVTEPELPDPHRLAAPMDDSLTLRNQITELYRQTFPAGDMSQQHTMRLEDNWCLASVDLQASEYEHYQVQLDEWLRVRGNIGLQTPLSSSSDSDAVPEPTRRNAAFIAPYEALPPDTLLHHASNNDSLALAVIVQRDDFAPQVKDQAAKQLLLLGDTSKGLTRLVINELSQITPLTADNSNRQAITHRFIKALALVKYGLQRQDTSALQAFLVYADKPAQWLKGVSPQDFIFSENQAMISEVSHTMVKDINLAREQVNLPPITMESESKVVAMHFQEKLAFLLHHYQQTLAQSWFPEEWHAQFVTQDECMQRKIATTRFWQEQLPALQEQWLSQDPQGVKKQAGND